MSQVSGSDVFCTHLIDDCLCKHVDFTRQTEAGEGDRKIDALLAIVDTLVDLFDSQRRQGICDTTDGVGVGVRGIWKVCCDAAGGIAKTI